MAFIYIDEQGFSRFISNASLRKKLITLSSEPEFTIPTEASLRLSEGENMQAFFNKLSVPTNILYYEDIFRYIQTISDNDLEIIKSLFSFERVHFLSVIYLLNRNIINIDDVKNVIKMPFFTRTEYILSMLSKEAKEEITIDELLLPFFDFIRINYEGRSRDREVISYQNIGYPTRMNITISNRQYTYFRDSITGDGNTKEFTINPFSKVDLTGTTDSWWLFNESLRETKREYDEIKKLNAGTEPTYAFSSFIDYMFNTQLGKITKRTLSNHLDALSKQSGSFAFTQSEWQDAVKLGASYVLSTSKPTFYNYFDYLHTAFTNASNYFTTNNPSGVPTSPGLSTIDTFDYITANNPELVHLKLFLEGVFPENMVEFSAQLGYEQIKRSDPRYMRKFFVSRTNTAKALIESSFIHQSLRGAQTIFNRLASANFLVNKTSNEIVSLGYMVDNSIFEDLKDLIKDKIAELEIVPIDLDSNVLDWSTVQTYLAQWNSLLIPELRLADIGDSGKNLVKNLYVDLLSNYIDYLNNPEATEISKVASESSKKIYRMVTFVQQTFVNINKFNNELKRSKELDLFLLFFYFYYETISKDTRIEYVYKYTAANNDSRNMINKVAL